MSEERCETCRFGREFSFPSEEMICRRFPPVVFSGFSGKTTSWPTVRAQTWCGEWETKAKEPVKIVMEDEEAR